MSVVTQGFKLAVKRYGVPARYLGEVRFVLDAEMRDVPPLIREEILGAPGGLSVEMCRAHVVDALKQIKEGCELNDLVRLADGAEVHKVCELIAAVVLAIPGIRVVHVEVTEMGSSWSFTPPEPEARPSHLKVVPEPAAGAEVGQVATGDLLKLVCSACGRGTALPAARENTQHTLCGGVWLATGGGQ